MYNDNTINVSDYDSYDTDDTDDNPIEMIVAIMKEYGLTKKDLIDALDDQPAGQLSMT